MSNNPWKSFGSASFETKEGYEKSLEGGNYFTLGKYEVQIEAVEPKIAKNGSSYLQVTFGSDSKTIKHNIFTTTVDKKTQEERLNMGYIRLFGGAVVADTNLRFEAFNDFFPHNPEKLEGLIGSRLSITIDRQKKGHTIEKHGEGHAIIDVETNEPIVLESGIENSFEQISDAKDVMISQGIDRAWNEVVKMEPLEGGVNDELVKGLISGKSSNKKRKVSM